MKNDHVLVQAVSRMIDVACHYRTEEFPTVYAEDLQIVMLKEDGQVATFDYGSNIAFFQGLKDSGAPALDTSVCFNYAGMQGDIGYVTATREMDLGFGRKRIVFTLMLREHQGRWRVFREHAVVVGDA